MMSSTTIAADGRARLPGEPECPAQVRQPGGTVEAMLLRRRLHAQENGGRLGARELRELTDDEVRLVVAACSQALDMDRHRHERGGPRDRDEGVQRRK